MHDEDNMESPIEILKEQLKTRLSTVENFIDVLDDDKLEHQLNDKTRKIGEIILHIIRSLEYYLTGVVDNKWEVLPYTYNEYSDHRKITDLFSNVKSRLLEKIQNLSPNNLHKEFSELDTPSYGLNLVVELLDHNAHHLGQISIYLRSLDVKPPKIKYII